MPPDVSTLLTPSARVPLSTQRCEASHPGWLTAMGAQAQEQLHRGSVRALPTPHRAWRPRVPIPAAPQSFPHATAVAVRAAPRLHHIAHEDLTEIESVLELYAQAVQQRLIGSSEADRLTFVGLAQHVVAARPTNPGGLFRHLLYRKRYQCVTQADEEVAMQRLKQHLYGSGGRARARHQHGMEVQTQT